MVLMPTGGGKSLCYQIPAMLRPGVGIVVSPLIALMKDQVDALLQAGVNAAYLNSSLSQNDAYFVEKQLLEGALDLLYVAPERLLTPRFMQLLERSRVGLFAIDEAHCVSQWGHDFRPEYIGLSVLAESFPEVPRIALTATADEVTRREIIQKLKLESAAKFVSSFDRPNIHYTVVNKQNARQQFMQFYTSQHQNDAGIVYCLSRKSVDSTAVALRKKGIHALAYHAGLSAEERQINQERFLKEEGVVMVATIAFGMGIDKPDVRFVAHLDLPKSLEGYYQETGRAGRDGLPANAFMTYGLGDVVSMRRMLAQSNANDLHKRAEQQKLEALLGYCESPRCRRQVLLEYFGESLTEPCGNCDTCVTPVETWQGTVAAQKALSTIYRTEQRFGAGHIIDVLLGKETERVRSLGHERLSTFGVGKEHDERQWRSVLRQLVAAGYVSTDGTYGSLLLTPRSARVLKGQEDVQFRYDPEPQKRPSLRDVRKNEQHTPEEQSLFDALRTLRLELAQAQNVPPYVIFHDKTLWQLAEDKPRTLTAMSAISGVGKSKLERYGEVFLELILEHLPDEDDTTSSAVTDGSLNFADTDEKDTYEQTLELILAGETFEGVARLRCLKVRTVEAHVAELVARGHLTVQEATGLSDDDINHIKDAWRSLPEDEQPYLKPLFEKLNQKYSYAALKCVRTELEY